MPLGRGSDGRFGLRPFCAKLTPTPFGTHRAFTHALPVVEELNADGRLMVAVISNVSRKG